MHINYTEKLEFNKITNILRDYCVTNIGKAIAKDLHPENKKEVVSYLLKETTEATTLIYKKKLPTFVEIIDFDYIQKMLQSGSSLNAKNLLEVVRILKLSNNLKEYFLEDNKDSNTSFPILDKYFSSFYINPCIRY